MPDFMGGVVANQDANNNESAVGGNDDITKLDLHYDELQFWNCRQKTFTQIISGDPFIIGHSTYGELGSYYLDSNDTDFEVQYVQNSHDLFPEFFMNDRFIASISTGSWDDINEDYCVTSGEFLETEIMAKEDKAYKYVTLSINSEYVTTGSDANAVLEVSALIGSESYNLIIDQKIFIDNSDTVNGLRIKIINGAAGGTLFGDTGLPFPMTLDDAGQEIRITSFLVKYGEL